METFQELFQTLGRELIESDGLAAEVISVAEARLGIKAPAVLREFYEAAGNADDFVRNHHTLLPPDEWFLQQDHLVFWAEHQNVVLWGVPLTSDDPLVYQGANNETLEWWPLESQLRVFLETMILWQGAYSGSMPLCDTSIITEPNIAKLRETWPRIEIVNQMEAFLKPWLILCLLKWEDEMRVFVGGHTESQFRELADELELSWEIECWEPHW